MHAAQALALLPDEASSMASSVDALFIGLTVVTVFFSAVICVAIVWLGLRYRKGRKVDRSNPPHEGLAIELTWTLIPLVIAMGLFVWATTLFFNNNRVPKNAMEVYVVGKQWMWKLQHPEGRWEMNELHIPVGKPVKLTMTSEDVIHSFFVPAFRVKQDVVPGRYSQLWFTATKVGTYHLFCAEFCGTNHSGMVGTVTVMEPADYEKWLSTGVYQGGLAAAGERLFVKNGCSGCHGGNTSVHAPPLEGIYGRPIPVQIPRSGQDLKDVPATTVVADDRYIHDSIVLPEKEVAAGFSPIMPTFQNKLSEEEILQLITYIRSLGTSNGTSNGGSRPEPNPPLSPEEYKARTGFVPSNLKQMQGAAGRRSAGASGGSAPGSRRSGVQGAGAVGGNDQRRGTGTQPTSSTPATGPAGKDAGGGAPSATSGAGRP